MATINLQQVKNPDESNYNQIDIIIGMSGKMWIRPSIEDLRGESFAMIKCYHNLSTEVSLEDILLHWNSNGTINFV